MIGRPEHAYSISVKQEQLSKLHKIKNHLSSTGFLEQETFMAEAFQNI